MFCFIHFAIFVRYTNRYFFCILVSNYQFKVLLNQKKLMNNLSNNKNLSSEDEIEEKIITLVEEKTALWDHRIPTAQRSQLKKTLLWAEIAKETGLDIDFIQKKWNSLLGQYKKSKHEKEGYRPSGCAAKSLSKNDFKFYKLMSFLKDVTDPTP